MTSSIQSPKRKLMWIDSRQDNDQLTGPRNEPRRWRPDKVLTKLKWRKLKRLLKTEETDEERRCANPIVSNGCVRGLSVVLAIEGCLQNQTIEFIFATEFMKDTCGKIYWWKSHGKQWKHVIWVRHLFLQWCRDQSFVQANWQCNYRLQHLKLIRLWERQMSRRVVKYRVVRTG